jgi:hypothetical protein
MIVGAVLGALALPLCATGQTAPAPVTLGQMTMGYTYFNRPGADLETHDADVADCAAEAERTISFDEQIHTGASQGLVGAIMGKVVQDAYHRGAAASGLENCMVVRGWRVVKLSDAEGEALSKLAPDALIAQLAPWIGAADPHGQVVRIWANDAANAVNSRYSIRPDHTNDGQLSLTEATSGNLHQFKVVSQPVDTARDVLDKKWPTKALTPANFGTAPDGSSILLLRVKGLSLRNGIGIWLNREGTASDILPSRTDHAPDMLLAAKGLLFANRAGDTYAFAVPPGRWRIYAMGFGPTINFCLGSPSFPVAAGEVVYAGSFDLSAADIGPDLDLAPIKAWLAGKPQAESVRPAVYTNGSRGLCGNNAIYALEVTGAPFQPDYAWGSSVKPLPALSPSAAALATPAAAPGN